MTVDRSNNNRSSQIPAILGPTASGKSALAMRAAKEFGCEIISCDSRQIYRGFDIGTAKPSIAERMAVPHHMIDIIDPSQEYSAYDYAIDTAGIIHQKVAEGKQVIICGGTGFYFKALSENSFADVNGSEEFRQECFERIKNSSSQILHDELASIDEEAARRINSNDLPRVIRALFIAKTSGRPVSDNFASVNHDREFDFLPIVLTVPREILYDRINFRALEMMNAGLYDEFISLREQGVTQNHPAMTSVGYRELFDVESGTSDAKTALDKMRHATRKYAKRQVTWFAHSCAGAMYVDATDIDAAWRILRPKLGRCFDQDRCNE